jgi:aldehyde reductase
MAKASPVLKLNSGYPIPVFGLGTWLSKPGEVAQAVKDALDIGYRHLDCAHVYGNQEEIGNALQEVFASGKVKREDVFITSKIWNTHHSRGKVSEAADIILNQLRLDYVDLLLIHWPHGMEEGGDLFPKNADGTMRYSGVDHLETWLGMEDVARTGKARSIGLSNHNSRQVKRIVENGSIKPAVLQVEGHPYFPQKKLKDFCAQYDIPLTLYSPLTNPGSIFRQDGQPCVLDESVIKEIAAKHGKTPAQVVLRWTIQYGVIVIPKSIKRHRLEENFNIWDFSLSDGDMEKIAGLENGYRFVKLERDRLAKDFPFDIEF